VFYTPLKVINHNVGILFYPLSHALGPTRQTKDSILDSIFKVDSQFESLKS
jgi:hypothetical protein